MGFSEQAADFVESRRRPKSYGDIFFHWLTVFLLVFFAVVMVTPFIWLLSSSLKTQINIFQYPPQLIPDPFVPENYVYALTYKPFGIYFRNTLLVAGLNVVAVVFTSSFCAYGFAPMRFPRARLLVWHCDGDALPAIRGAAGSQFHRVFTPGLG